MRKQKEEHKQKEQERIIAEKKRMVEFAENGSLGSADGPPSKKQTHKETMLRVLHNNPEVFKVNQILHTLSRLKKELSGEETLQHPDELPDSGPNAPPTAQLRDDKMQQYVDLSIKVALAHQFLKLKIEEIQAERHHSSKKPPKQARLQSDRGFLLKSDASLACSTTGLHLHRLRSKKMTGGIFELLKLKQRLDALQKERGITSTPDFPIAAV